MNKIKNFLFYGGLLILNCIFLAVFTFLLIFIMSRTFQEIVGKDNIQTMDKAATKFINTQWKNLEDYANDR